jgi:hypothetical protein
MISLELDIRRNGFSILPAISFTDHGMESTLFLQKGVDPNLAGEWSLVTSALKGMYATVDLLWSVPIAKEWAFEYGAGVGIGLMFGTLRNEWVTPDPNGPYGATSGGQPYSFRICQTVNDGLGCSPEDQDPTPTPKLVG